MKIVLEELLDRKEAVNDEYYTINIDDNLIKISAATPANKVSACPSTLTKVSVYH